MEFLATSERSQELLKKPFFVGIGGTGMSALAQYLAMDSLNREVSGSDRSFDKGENESVQKIYHGLGIQLFPQDGSGIHPNTTCIVCSTAIEENHPEIARAKELGIPRMHRSQVLALLSSQKKSIAISGTSGKSTVTAMIFAILRDAGLSPSLITGAPLHHFLPNAHPQKVLGNAWADTGEWLVFEADESDGTLIQYHPNIGVVLNIEKDHKEVSELMPLFETFVKQTQSMNGKVFLNSKDPNAHKLSKLFTSNTSGPNTFGPRSFKLKNEIKKNSSQNAELELQVYQLQKVKKGDWESQFQINNVLFCVPVPGEHNIENASLSIAVCASLGVSLEQCSTGLSKYQGISRRHHKVGDSGSVLVIDDFAHNPAKIAACLQTVQSMERAKQTPSRVVAIFHPHGYGPLKLLFQEFVTAFKENLKEHDLLLIPEVYYAGGTANKDISSQDLCNKLHQGIYFNSKKTLMDSLLNHIKPGDIIVNMGARDPNLGNFAEELFQKTQCINSANS